MNCANQTRLSPLHATNKMRSTEQVAEDGVFCPQGPNLPDTHGVPWFIEKQEHKNHENEQKTISYTKQYGI